MISFKPSTAGLFITLFWLALPGLVAAPFVFWQTLWGGILFLAIWGVILLGPVHLHLASLRGSCTLVELRLERGILFTTRRRIPTRFITGVLRLQSPLSRWAGCCILLLYTSGSVIVLPGLPQKTAEQLATLLEGGRL